MMAAAPWLLKLVIPHQISAKEIVISMAVACLSFTLFFFLGRYSQTLDYEIWSGAITSKSRDEGTYLRTYECNCHRVCSGSGKDEVCTEKCETCTERRYTVTWEAYSNIGNFRIEHLDSLYSSVYMTPDPPRYSIIKQGDPVSKTVAFTNYVKAVPESIFHDRSVNKAFEGMIPNYPDKIYDFYHIDRVLSVGVTLPDLKIWNMSLSAMMCDLGFISKSNVIIVFVNTEDSAYVESLKSAWLNGKKNDVIVVFGITQYPQVKWVEVFGWSDEELFKTELSSELSEQKEVNVYKTLDTIKIHVQKSFKYKDMEDFAYLSSSIEPPWWLTLIACILSVGASVGAVLFSRRL